VAQAARCDLGVDLIVEVAGRGVAALAQRLGHSPRRLGRVADDADVDRAVGADGVDVAIDLDDKRAAASSSAAALTASAAGRMGVARANGGGGATASPVSAAWTSSGSISATVWRSRPARQYARMTSPPAVAGVWMRSGKAPTVATACPRLRRWSPERP
jgi:hypothetical protein